RQLQQHLRWSQHPAHARRGVWTEHLGTWGRLDAAPHGRLLPVIQPFELREFSRAIVAKRMIWSSRFSHACAVKCTGIICFKEYAFQRSEERRVGKECRSRL